MGRWLRGRTARRPGAPPGTAEPGEAGGAPAPAGSTGSGAVPSRAGGTGPGSDGGDAPSRSIGPGGAGPVAEAPALEVSDLAKRFGSTEAVKGVSFGLVRGSSLALVGPDGAGKTTTMRMLCGLVRGDRGTVRVFGEEPRSRGAKRRMGYLSQRFSLYGDLSVDENIAFFAEIHGVPSYRDRRDRLLEFTRLARFRDRPAGKLSGGMKQKLALACALVHEPELLLLDEPTTGVDPVARREFWDILARLLAEGMSLVVTTPYLDEAERCDEVALMAGGNFLATGSPAELKASLPYAVAELGCQDVRAAVRALSGGGPWVDIQAFGDRLALLAEDPEEALIRARGVLDEAGIPYGAGRVAAPSLENLFMHLLGPEARTP